MNTQFRLGFLPGILLAFAATLVLASTASAGNSFSMTGEWAANRGALVDIPINGGPSLCVVVAPDEPPSKNALIPGPGTLPTPVGGCVGAGKYPPGTAPPRFAWPRSSMQPIFGFQQRKGGIPGAATITTSGPAGSFVIPPGAFGQAAPVPSSTATVMLVPTVVQLQTALSAVGPPSPTHAAGALPTFAIQQPAAFMKDAWSMDAGQASTLLPIAQQRPMADFQWCPGTVGAGGLCPGTTLVGGTGAGALDGIVRYKSGPNKFGGTMGMMLGGGGSTSVRGGFITVAPTTMTLMGGPGFGRTMLPLLAHLPFGGGPIMNPQVQGVGYAFTNTIALAAAKFHADYLTSMHVSGVTSGGGMITTSGPTGFGTISADTNVNYGFPWTTGNVSVMNVELGPFLSGQTGTLTAMGADNRSAGGNGTITLVAGGTANRVLSGLDFEALEVVTLQFASNTPSMGPAGLATTALLLSLTAGFALRKRFSSKA